MYYIDEERDEIYIDDEDFDEEEVEYDLHVVFKTDKGNTKEIDVNHSFEVCGNGWYEDLTGEGYHAYFWEPDMKEVEHYIKYLKGVVKDIPEREMLCESIYDVIEDIEQDENIIEFITVEFK